jgi:ribosomal protein S18 acetylase RimI-like enzyme
VSCNKLIVFKSSKILYYCFPPPAKWQRLQIKRRCTLDKVIKMSFIVIKKMEIRKATKKDAEQIAKLYLQFWEVHKKINPLHQLDFIINYKNCLKDVKKLVNYKSYKLYVAQENKEIVGFILFTIKKNPEGFKVRRYGFLEETAIDKKHRGKGIAKDLHNFALKYFKKKGLKYVSCSVEIDNVIAQKVWQKLGFKKVSIDLIKEI